MWGRSTHCGRGGRTSGALHLCKRIAHMENCEVLGWYSAMIARHDGGKSAPIVAASHAFFFSTKYGCGTCVGKAAESSAAQEWSLECRNRRSPCNLLVGSHFYLRLVRANLFWSSSSALSTIMCRKLHSLIEQTPRRRSTQKRLLAVASPSLVGSVGGIAAGMRCPRTRQVCSQSR